MSSFEENPGKFLNNNVNYNPMSDRYSRQSYSIGRESITNFINSKILVIGYNGISEEIIKNCVLMGIGNVDIYDEIDFVNENNYFDNENLYFNKSDNNIPIDKLKKLNPYVNINKVNLKDDNGMLKCDIFNNYSLIVLTNGEIEEGIMVNKITRTINIPLIICGTCGLTGYVFNDHGFNFEIKNVDGDEPEDLLIETTIDDKIEFKNKHKLNDIDTISVIFKNDFIHDIKIKKVLNPKTIQVDSDIYLNCDTLKSIKKTKKTKKCSDISYEELIDQIKKNKEYNKLVVDFSCLMGMDRNIIMSILHITLDKYNKQFSCLPRPWNETDYQIFEEILLKDLNEKEKKLMNENKKLVKKFCYTCSGSFKPTDSILGGIASHEIIKIINKKFNPLDQCIYVDFLDELIMDDELEDNCLNNLNYESIPSRLHNGIINIFGKQFYEELINKKPFIVGSGAIGCELLKNLSCLGINSMTVTDNDNIEKSNLSRQLLFSDDDIGKSKAKCAAEKIMELKLGVFVNFYDEKVCSETENIFNLNFHKNIDIYMNALDNLDARKYMDSMAVKYSKPLIDSGTKGSEGSINVVIPYLTGSYTSQKNDSGDDEGIPLCTLKNFPTKQEHTIQWARELFEEEFKMIPSLIKEYSLDNNSKIDRESLGEIKRVYKLLYKFHDFDYSKKSLLNLGKIIFKNNYHDNIKKLYEDYQNKEHNNKMPIEIDYKKCEVFFVINCLQIFNQIFGINVDSIENYEIDYSKYQYNDQEIENLERDIVVVKLKNILNNFKNKTLNEVNFEKDDDTLFHIDWVTCSSNIRNLQYGIKETDTYQTRFIAGKIIPAMITTTSIIAGYQSIEFVKIVKLYKKNKYDIGINKELFVSEFNGKVDVKKDIEIYKDRYVNLNSNYYISDEPSHCKNITIPGDNNISLNVWSKFISKSSKIKDIIKEINDKIQNTLTILMIIECGEKIEIVYDNDEEDEDKFSKENIDEYYAQVIFEEYPEESFYVINLEKFALDDNNNNNY